MKRRPAALCLAAALLTAAAGCGGPQSAPDGSAGDAPVYSNLTDAAAREETASALSAAGIAGDAVDAFLALAEDYNALVGEQPYFHDGWTPLPAEGVDYDGQDTYALWMDARPYADANCRITAFGLLRDVISAAAPMEADGFLMTDQDALESYELCGLDGEEQGVFYAVFDPVPVKATTDAQAVADAVLAEWENRGVAFREGGASLVSVVFNSELDDIAYVGHAGALVPDGEGWLFAEKTAPTQPYQVTRYQTREQVRDDLMARFGTQYTEGLTAKPFLLENGHAF